MKNTKKTVFINPIDPFNSHDIRKLDLHIEREATAKDAKQKKAQFYNVRPTYNPTQGLL